VADASTVPGRKLTAGEERVLAAARSGELADLSELSDDDRVVSAELIRGLCVGDEAAGVDLRGIRVRSARVRGVLDLSFCTVPHPVWFEETSFAEEPALSYSRLAALVFSGCKLPGLRAYGARVEHFLSLPKSEFGGLVQLYGAQIGGPLDCSDARVVNEGGQALNLEGAEVGDYLWLRGLHANGAVTLSRAKIGGGLDCSGATFANEGGQALNLEDVNVGILVRFRDVAATGAVTLAFARIGAQLDCSSATFANPGGEALNAYRAEIDGGVFLADGFGATGEVTLSDAKIGGTLAVRSAALTNEQGSALDAAHAEIGGSASLFRVEASGKVDFYEATIGGTFSCFDATFQDEGGSALSLASADVDGDLWLNEVSATGTVSLSNARIRGTLHSMRATLVNEDGTALNLYGAEIGDAELNELTATGGMNLESARIARDLRCARVTIAHKGEGCALWARGAEIGRNLDVRESTVQGTVELFVATIGSVLAFFETNVNADGDAIAAIGVQVGGGVLLSELNATGAVKLSDANIRGELACSGSVLRNEERNALDLRSTEIGSELKIFDSRITGGVNLYRASAAALQDDVGTGDNRLGSWSGVDPLILEGFTYHQFIDRSGSPLDRRRWLRQTHGYQAGAWQQLASVYRAHGRDEKATLTAIAMHNDRLARGGLPGLRKVGRWILRLTIGHGYRPWLAGVWALGIILLFAAVVALGSDRFLPEQGVESSSPQPIAYAADTFLPVVDLGEADQWQATGWMQWIVWTVILLGWVLTTIFVAGFTRAVRS
jgi:hypothetical protein